MAVFIMFKITSYFRYLINLTKNQPAPARKSYNSLLLNFVATFVKLLLLLVYKKWLQMNSPESSK